MIAAPGAIQPQARDSSGGQSEISQDEDSERDPHVLIMKVSL